MGVKIRERKGAWWLVIDYQGHRKSKCVGSGPKAKKAAELAAVQIQARLAVGDSSAIETQQAVPVAEPATFPLLRDAVPEWINRQERSGEVRPSTARAYRSRVRKWVFPHVLSDGRLLGDVPVNAVTREMIGAVIWQVKAAGRSLAIIEAIRNPLRGYYASLIETKALSGPNPAADLRYFIGKGAHRKARRRVAAFFAQEEGPQLVATAKALWPRWAPFILTGLLAGLRWGESAALYKTDIDWTRGRIHVQRTWSEKGGRIEPCKDGEDRWVKASPALLAALREHLALVERDAQANDWTPEQRQLVFPTTAGRIIRYSHFLEGVWQPLLSKAGLPYRKYHATRHTYATWLLSDGADLRWVQQQLGHASIGQTADTYGHVQPDRHESAVGGLDRYLTT
jgi:integrase